MKVRTKLLLGFISVIFIYSIGLAITFYQLHVINTNVEEMDRRTERKFDLSEIRSLDRAKRGQLLEYIIESGSGLVENYKARQAAQHELLKKIEPFMRTDEQKTLYQNVLQSNKVIDDTFFRDIVPGIEQGNVDTARKSYASLSEDRKKIIDSIDKLIISVDAEAEVAIQSAHSKVLNSISILIIVTILSLVSGVGIALFMGRKIANPIVEIQKASVRVANGDLTVERLVNKSKDEVGVLTEAINTMVDNLKTLIKDTAEISEKLASSSEELTASSNEMARGIEQVAATTEQLASGAGDQAMHAAETLEVIHQVAKEVDVIQQSSQEIAQASELANEASHHGISSVNQSKKQMSIIEGKVGFTAEIVRNLSSKSQEISQIVTAIHSIAAQTNLLALNAAIEAARAGEQGRGFAVVADEVRKLAEQSGESTKQIGEIMSSVLEETLQAEKSMHEVVQAVETGTEVMNQNERSFDAIAKIIEELAGKIKEVSDRALQINEISSKAVQSVENISAITEQSSAGSEELAASMEQQSASMQEINGMAISLANMAELLNTNIRNFKL